MYKLTVSVSRLEINFGQLSIRVVYSESSVLGLHYQIACLSYLLLYLFYTVLNVNSAVQVLRVDQL
jgi:hypothetical protein